MSNENNSSSKVAIGQVLTSTLKALLYPKVLLTLVLSTLGVMIFWISIAVAAWPYVRGLAESFDKKPIILVEWFQSFHFLQGFDFIGVFLFILFVIALLPLIVISSTLVCSFISSTYLIQYIGQKDFPVLSQKGRARLAASMMTFLKYTFLYLLSSLVVVPIGWFFAAGPLLSWGLTAWYNMRIGSFDVLSTWADDQELKVLRNEEGFKSFAVSMISSATLFVPFTALVMPIIVNLALTYYYLARLEDIRNQQTAV